MIAYKLFRETKSGERKSLFINKTQHYIKDHWYEAKEYPTNGYKVRKGFHCLAKPNAPHLSMKGRAWYFVEIIDFKMMKRPDSQGGVWYIAQYMRILDKLRDEQI